MKTNLMAALSAVAASLATLAPNLVHAQTAIPASPVGQMTAFPTIVQTGTKPTLTWSILYPSKVSDLVQINPPGTLIPIDTTYAAIQIVGTEVPPCETCGNVVVKAIKPSVWPWPGDATQSLFSGNELGTRPVWARGLSSKSVLANVERLYAGFRELYVNPTLVLRGRYASSASSSPFSNFGGASSQGSNMITTSTTTVAMPPTDARVSFNGGPYEQIFFGTQADVDPSKILYVKKLLKNQTLDFGGRYLRNGGTWSPFYTTRSSNLQVIALVKGDLPPTSFSLFRQGFLAAYLKPYLDSTGHVNIGPLSVLIVMELDNSDHTLGCFDYQDQVLLVTLSGKHPNNGNGNNLDGVDSSNPGLGHGGPNGEIDPSGGFDDEIR